MRPLADLLSHLRVRPYRRWVGAIVALMAMSTATPAQEPAALSGIEWVGYQLVSSQRFDRTRTDFVYRVVARNTTASFGADIAGTVASTNAATTILEGNASFGDIGAQTNGLSTDTITIRHDRTQAFDPGALRWSFTGFLVTAAVLPQDPGPAGELTLEGVDVNANGVRDDLERYILTRQSDPAHRNVLMEYARLFGEALSATTASVAQDVKRRQISNLDCAAINFGENSEPTTLAVLAVGLNTAARARRYFEFDALTAGLYVLPTGPRDTECASESL